MNILRASQVAEKIGVSKNTLYRIAADTKQGFPKRIAISSKTVGWLESEINEWLCKKAESRSNGNAL